MALLIVFFVISILFSFLCSIWEAVLLSIPASHVEILYKEGAWVGKRLKEFKSEIDRPLSAILTLNTLAHTVGAMGVGSQASKLFAGSGWDIMGLHLSVEGLIAALMTLAILILSEIIPKTLGANFWKALTKFTVTSVHGIIVALYPLVWVSEKITKRLKKDKDKSVLSRSDFSIMAEIGSKEGVLDAGEFRIINNLLRFDSIMAKDIMTPRTVVVAVPDTMTVEKYYEANPDLRFSRIPIYQGSKDNVTGLFLKDELLLHLAKGDRDLPVGEIARQIELVNEKTSITKIFNQLLEKRIHLALVVDDYGGMSGVVTMEDVLETLLGLEIVDESDLSENMQALAHRKWMERAKKLGLMEGESDLDK